MFIDSPRGIDLILHSTLSRHSTTELHHVMFKKDPSVSTAMTGRLSSAIRACCTYSSSVVEHPLMVRWVIRSIPHGEPIELFVIPASAP